MLMKPLILMINKCDFVVAGLAGRQFAKNVGLLPIDGWGTCVHALGMRVVPLKPELEGLVSSPLAGAT